MPYDDAPGRDQPADGAQIREREERNAATRADAPTRERDREAPEKEREKERAPSAPSRENKGRGGAEQSEGGDKGSGDDKADDKKKRRSPWVWVILAIVVFAAAIGGVTYWYATRNEVTTDDAYTDGNAITIAPQVNGYVVQLAVNDNQFVHAGDVLIKIDPRDYTAARDQARGRLEATQGQLAAARAALEVAQKNFPARLASAQAQLQSARATLFKAEADDRRQHAVSRGATTQEQVDQADAALLQAKAGVAQAEAAVQEATPVPQNIAQAAALPTQIEGQLVEDKAQLDQAELNLSRTVVTAPQDGWVTKRNVNMGDYATPGAAIMSLVSPQVWITANFKETQLDRVRKGQPVDISVDAYPSLKLSGHVDSVQLGSGSKFSAFPAENATGNYVKIVQRVPVKIDIDHGLDPNLPLPLGISVEPTINVK